MPVDHVFGSPATELKLSVVKAYLHAFTTALHRSFGQLWYIDGFAGTGERAERVPARRGGLLGDDLPERINRWRGSAKIAIDVEPPFNRLIFVEKRPKAVRALREIRDQYADRQIDVIEGDANEEIRKIASSTNWRRIRAVMFLDPFGMSVDWQTLQVIARTKAIDVWYLFSLSGFYRQAARSAAALDHDKRAAITRVLGTSEWEKELYAPAPGFFSDCMPLQRTANVSGLQDYVWRRLKTIFPAVLKPLPLPIDKRPQKFSLFFAISNSEGPAIGLATRIASHILKPDQILKAGMSSQSRPW